MMLIKIDGVVTLQVATSLGLLQNYLAGRKPCNKLVEAAR
ncbi:hypothetical protein B835_887 [Enterococcus mundtii 3F]|nr:hypothetical protein [Enterococcus mundtii 3F]